MISSIQIQYINGRADLPHSQAAYSQYMSFNVVLWHSEKECEICSKKSLTVFPKKDEEVSTFASPKSILDGPIVKPKQEVLNTHICEGEAPKLIEFLNVKSFCFSHSRINISISAPYVKGGKI